MMALGVLNTMIPHLCLYLRYRWNKVNFSCFSSARITFDRLLLWRQIEGENWAMVMLSWPVNQPRQPAHSFSGSEEMNKSSVRLEYVGDLRKRYVTRDVPN